MRPKNNISLYQIGGDDSTINNLYCEENCVSNIDIILTSRIEQKGCIDVQDNMPRIYGQTEVLNLITQESGVASWNICVGQLEARTRQVG